MRLAARARPCCNGSAEQKGRKRQRVFSVRRVCRAHGSLRPGRRAPLLPRLHLNAGVQFGVAGLGSVAVCILRRERLSSFGLRRKGALPAILGTLLCFVPSVLVLLGAGKVEGYFPLDIRIAQEVRSAGLPGSILGMALIAVICDKIDARYPAKPRFLSWGALVCATVCLLFHPMEISLWGLLESLTTFAAIYGMLLVKRETGNAWGCVAAFLLIWNAL